jgi:hypothetical protein
MVLKGADLYAQAIAEATAQIAKFPEYIAVFGGGLANCDEVSRNVASKSQRDSFVRWVRSMRTDLAPLLVTPESFEDWSDFNTYSDLLAFEQDLGYLTSVVLVFLEGYGAIAELGSFSQINSLKDRLVVVVYDDQHPKKSFISLGPLRQLANADPNSVCAVPHRNGFSLDEDIDVIMRHIDEKRDVGRRKLSFDKGQTQHHFVAALDIISILEVVNFGDIQIALNALGIHPSESRLRQMLFTLSAIGAIGCRQYGGNTYYFPTLRRIEWLNYQGCGSIRFNRARLIARLQEAKQPTDDRTKVGRVVFAGEVAR